VASKLKIEDELRPALWWTYLADQIKRCVEGINRVHSVVAKVLDEPWDWNLLDRQQKRERRREI
jgi:hypothetical protein